jgi:hypothetical protein
MKALRLSTKKLFIIYVALWFLPFLLPPASMAEKGPSEEYVYLLKVEGGRLYRMHDQTSGDKKEMVKKEVRRMELIPPGTMLEIEKGTSVFLTCAGCRVLTLTDKNSPYVVKMGDFKKDASSSSKLMENFTAALKNYIYPDSRPVPKIQLRVRGLHSDVGKTDLCQTLWPPDRSDIMPIDPITLKWRSKSNNFSLEIKELESKAMVYSGKNIMGKSEVPAGIFKPCRRYEWSVVEEKTGNKCKATFTILSKDESSRIIKIINNLMDLLPPETDIETKCRLQAGYLTSEGLHYDAWQWLERNGILQHEESEN